MEAVFTLPYPEYVVAEELSKYLRKGDSYSVCVPVSRQQKGIDMLVYNMKTGRSATIQVKSSRAYLGRQKKRDALAEVFDFHLWFNALDPAYTSSDFYAFIGLYPKRTIISHRLSHSRDPKKWWAPIILLLPGPEVSRLMENILIRGERFFYVSFNNDLKRVFLSRGLEKTQEWTHHLLNKSVFCIADFLKG